MHQPREVPLDPLNVRPAAADLDPSQIREISRMGIGREDTIGLWLGEGDAPTPPFIVDAATRAARVAEC